MSSLSSVLCPLSSVPLRLAHLIDLKCVGGVEAMYLDFIRSPAPDGLAVEHHTIVDRLRVAPCFKTALYRDSASVTTPKKWGGVTLPRRPYLLRAYRRLSLLRAIKPDLVIAWNQYTHFCGLRVDLACPLVYYEHGISWNAHLAAQRQHFFPQVHMAIAASHAAKRMLELKHQAPFPITVCRNPLRLALSNKIATVRYLPTDRPLRLGCAARLVPQKAVALLILTVHALRERGIVVEALIAGEGPQRAQIAALTQRLHLTQSVRLLGLVDNMEDFYRDIDLFVCPSVYEPLGLVCLEAMRQGVPVLCSTVDGLSEAVIDRVTGLCLTPTLSPKDYTQLSGIPSEEPSVVYDPSADCLLSARFLAPAVMAEAISHFLADPQRYSTMSAACIDHVKRHFAYSSYLKNFYGLLSAALQKNC